MKINWKKLILSFIIVFLVAFIGSLFTSPNTSTDWYESIKPEITPPSLVFPIVWNILFTLISISLYLVLISKNSSKKIYFLFGINFILNILWSLIFFELRLTQIAFIEIILLLVSTLLLIINTYKINKISSYLLIPYLLWLSFATILNFLIAF